MPAAPLRPRVGKAGLRATAALLTLSMLLPPAGAQAGGQTVELNSSGGYQSMRLPAGTREVELVEQRRGACRFNRTWGYDLTNSELWVNGGCGGLFRMVGAPAEPAAPDSSNAGAAIAAALAIAGIAILASRDRKDNNNPPPFEPPPVNGREGPIREGGGLCLDMRGREVVQGTPAIVFSCNNGRNQRFSWGRNGEIRVAGMCLDLANRSNANGAALVAWPCNGGNNQRWNAQGSQISSRQNGKCLDTRNNRPRPEQAVVMWDCNNSSSQRWWW